MDGAGGPPSRLLEGGAEEQPVGSGTKQRNRDQSHRQQKAAPKAAGDPATHYLSQNGRVRRQDRRRLRYDDKIPAT